ncbi:MAG TPA: phosphate-starvation-inducible PsiE family protein [Burkholderiales bacterium]|nr:phosphate-starvation-inducible PsiE family protein [Burkholderiales bacterium]
MESVKQRMDRLGNDLVSGFQVAALFVIGATIAWSAAHDYLEMMRAGGAKLDDILLLFIYLELGTMVGIYFRTEQLPVLFLLYVAITAITRFLVVDVKSLPVESVFIVSATILLLTAAVLIIQLTKSRFATATEDAFGEAEPRSGTRATTRRRS